jgi:predicted ABC-type ATPase
MPTGYEARFGKPPALHRYRWSQRQATGYRIEIIFLQLPSARLALRRIAARVKQGGHAVPANDVVRRFKRGWENFSAVYQPMADYWAIYDNAGDIPVLKEQKL